MIYRLIFLRNSILDAICNAVGLRRRGSFTSISHETREGFSKCTPFELSTVSDTAGAFPEDPRDGPGLVLSARSGIDGCEVLLALGTALDWLKAGDFACELDGGSDTVVVVGTLDRVTGV